MSDMANEASQLKLAVHNAYASLASLSQLAVISPL